MRLLLSCFSQEIQEISENFPERDSPELLSSCSRTQYQAFKRSTIARQVRADGVCSAASVAPQIVPGASDERLRPDRLDLEVQADAGDFDVERLGQPVAVGQFEPEAAVGHVHHRRRDVP